MRLVDGQVVFAASDLNDYLACPHRVALNHRALLRGDAPPDDDPTLRIIAEKGRQHELRVLEGMEAGGVAVVRVPEGDNTAHDLLRAVATTRRAMASGAEAIYQASFVNGAWTGRADFLVRVDDAPSALGSWSYDVADTKLAIRAKPQFLVQLCTYAELVAAVQGVLPRSVRALFGDGTATAYDPRRYVAYVRAAQRRFAQAVGALDPDAVPERVTACEQCAWSARCDGVRRGVDHLSLVAGMRRDQTKRLVAAGIATLERLATASADAHPPKMAAQTFANLHRQAALQLSQRTTGAHRYELLAPRELHGFAALPPPSDGDVYFDMEGDPLYEAGKGPGVSVRRVRPGRRAPDVSRVLGRDAGGREGARSRGSSTGSWRTARRTRTRTCTITRRTRRRRCASSRCATARARTRSTTCCAARCSSICTRW